MKQSFDHIRADVSQLTDEPISFMDLRHKVDVLFRKEAASIAKQNLKLQSRGQQVSEARREAEVFNCWMDGFVSYTLLIYHSEPFS